MDRWFEIEIEGCDAVWRVARASLTEAIHAPLTLDVVAYAVDSVGARHDVAPAELLGRPARMLCTLDDGSEREVEGYVERVEAADAAYRLVVAPRVAVLADAIDYQVFVERDALEIARAVLGKHGISITGDATRPLPKRAQCVQAFESELAFVSRLLAEEGIAWIASGKDTIAIADDTTSWRDGVTLPVRDDAGLLVGEGVHRLTLRRAKTWGAVLLGEYDFTNPQLDLTTRAVDSAASLERFEYPGGYRDAGVGGALARMRLDEVTGKQIVLRGEASSRRLVAGEVLTLEDAPRADINARWLLVRVVHHWRDVGTAAPVHVARFVAVSAATAFRPARARAPRVPGVQTATVTGASPMEIQTEAFGRVHVLHRWDRRSPPTDKASAWHRVVQPSLSGSLLQPRVGWEALVGHRGASGDEPYVIGRLYNGTALPPVTLPANKVKSAFGSASTPGGSGANVLTTDDSSGREGMSFAASKDMREKTENDKKTAIAATDQHQVSGDRALIVGQVHSVSVAGAQTHSVGGGREVNVDANKEISAASESLSVGGPRLFTVAGDYGTSCASLLRLVGAAKVETALEHQARAVQGASLVLVGATWKTLAGAHASISVSGASTESIGGTKSISTARYALIVKGALKETLASRNVSAGGDCVAEFGGSASYNISSSAKLQGANVVVKARSKLTIKAGGVTIEMTPGEVTVKGDFQGSVAALDSGDQKYG